MLNPIIASPEIKFILSCSRTVMNEKSILSLNGLLKCGLDWEKAVRLAKDNGVAGLIYNNIKKADYLKNDIPDKVLIGLEDYYNLVLTKNLVLWNEFLNVWDNFKKNNIEIIPLKGIIFAESLYHNIALRPIIADIDILIKQNHINLANHILEDLGYKLIIKDSSHVNTYSKNGTILELHWFMLPSWLNRIKTEKLWENSAIYTIDDRDIRILSFEDSLMVSALQTRQDWPLFKLFRICDINEILVQHENHLNWNYILNEGREYGIYQTLCFNLYFCQQLFGSPIPKNVLMKISKNYPKIRFSISLLYKKLESILERESSTNNKNIYDFYGYISKFLMTDSLVDCVKIFRHI